MASAKDLFVRALGRLGLATPAYRVYEHLLARRETRQGLVAERGPDGLPFPPAAVMHSVAGTADTAWFLEGGGLAVKALREALSRHGRRLEEMQSVLEFGCGCGRVVRHLKDLPGDVSACDWNGRAIRWCQESLLFARFEQNQLAPPLTYADGAFDFVYALSVFTHMGDDLQRPWMAELRRILRPGGLLVVTTHGQRYADRLDEDQREQFARGEFLVRRAEGAGTNLCSSFHPDAYLRGAFSEGFRLIEIVPEGALGNPHQDLTLLQRPE